MVNKAFQTLIFLFLISCAQTSLESKNSKVVHFNYFDNRIMVPTTINGQGPFYMVFDTGGSNMLMPETVKKLKLKTTPAGFGGGAGDKQIPMHNTKVQSYKVGSIKMVNQNFMVMDLSHIKKAFGFKHLDGIIGYELLQEYVATINYDEKYIKFEHFADFKPNGKSISFRLYNNKPVIPAQIDNQKAELLIDTGDRSSFTIFKKFAKKHQVDQNFSKKEVISGYGVGGPIPARLGQIPNLNFDNQVQLNNIPSRLPLTSTGFFAYSDLGGSVGNGLLQDFIVSFNYKNKEMILRPGLRKNGPYKFVPPRKI